MQEKMPIFYKVIFIYFSQFCGINFKFLLFKELNRVRRAALTFGFYELFQGLSKMLDRELHHFANSYNNEATFQLTHVIKCLNSNEFKDFRKDIQPWVSQQPYAGKGGKQ